MYIGVCIYIYQLYHLSSSKPMTLAYRHFRSLQTLEPSFFSLWTPDGLLPNTITYTSLIKATSKFGDLPGPTKPKSQVVVLHP